MKIDYCRHIVKYISWKRAFVSSFILLGLLSFPAHARQAKGAKRAGKNEVVSQEQIVTRKFLERNREREMLSLKSAEADIDKLVVVAVKEYRNGEFEKAIRNYRDAKKRLEKLQQRILKLEGLEGKALEENIDKYAELKHIKRLNEKIDACRKAIARSYRYWAQSIYFDAEKFADLANFDDAISKCEEAIAVYPECKKEMDKAIAHYKKLRDKVKEKIDFEDSVSNKEDVKTLRVLIRKGEVFYTSGQWEKSRNLFEQVLSRDPYNEVAIDYLRKINIKLSEMGRRRMDLVHSERIVESGWSALTPIISYREAEDAGVASEEGIAKDSEDSILQKKLKSIVLKSGIDFPDSPLSTVITTLIQYSKDYDNVDKNRSGVNIVALGRFNTALTDDELQQTGRNNAQGQGQGAADNSPAAKDPTVTLSIFSPITLEDAIKRVCENINAVYKVNTTEGVVEIAPTVQDLDDVLQTEYFELSNVLNPTSLLTGNKTIHDTYFSAVPRPEGAYTSLDPVAGRLIVTNTPDNIRAMRQIFEKINSTKPQILIQAKFVDVIMKDLEELGFQYTFSRNASNEKYAMGSDMKEFVYTGGDAVYFDNKEYNVYVKPSEDDPKNANWYQFYKTTSSFPLLSSENQIVDPNSGTVYDRGSDNINITYYYKDSPVSNGSITWGKNAKLTRVYDQAGTPVTDVNLETKFGQMWEFDAFTNKGYGLNAQVYALDQAGASDLLYCPRITTMDGSPASLDMVVIKDYPEEWEEPEITLMDNIPVFMGSVPELEEQEEGILFSVTPNLNPIEGPDNFETIFLEFDQLQLFKFSGWDDYSYSLPIDDGTGNYVNFPNIMRMPIFQKREIKTKVSCRDGATVVIGGLINDESSVINDKYPILGDIPLIGRLFQSKGRNTYKSNLLIFVTCRLVLPDGTPYGSREEAGKTAFRY